MSILTCNFLRGGSYEGTESCSVGPVRWEWVFGSDLAANGSEDSFGQCHNPDASEFSGSDNLFIRCIEELSIKVSYISREFHKGLFCWVPVNLGQGAVCIMCVVLKCGVVGKGSINEAKNIGAK